jgi:hypothetical protein
MWDFQNAVPLIACGVLNQTLIHSLNPQLALFILEPILLLPCTTPAAGQQTHLWLPRHPFGFFTQNGPGISSS